MRFAGFLPLAVLVAATSVAGARPGDDYMLASRSGADMSLSARDLQLLDYLVARGEPDIDQKYRALLAASNPRPGQPRLKPHMTHQEYVKAYAKWEGMQTTAAAKKPRSTSSS